MSVLIPPAAILVLFSIAYLLRFLTSVLPHGVKGINRG